MSNTTIKGWVAFYNNQRLEILINSDANSLYNAKLYAIDKMNVPKGKQSLIAIEPVY